MIPQDIHQNITHGFNLSHLGKERIFDHLIIFLFSIKVKKDTADIISAPKVARAAPVYEYDRLEIAETFSV